ncbi:MAG: porin [Rickettsiales bacterium]|jgi:hypothetical protein|nr:porin [Rickettsiales bacterium]
MGLKHGLLVFIFAVAPDWCFSYQPTSNHSYIKNSNFAGNYAMEVGGKINSKLLLHGNDFASLDPESNLSLDIDLYHVNAGVLKYGVRINPSFNNYFGNGVDYYLFINGRLGKIEVGAVTDAVENLKIGAGPLSIGSGMAGSNFGRHVEFPADSGHLLFEPATMMDQNFGFADGKLIRKSWNHSKYLNKINYYSPELFGFQLGFSLTPNVIMTNKDLGLIDENKFDFGYVLSGALNYIVTIWDLSIAASVAFENNVADPTGKIKKNVEKHPLAAKFCSHEFGLSLSYFGMTIAGSFGQADRTPNKDLTASRDNIAKMKSWYVTGGGNYEIGSFTVSGVYFESRTGGNILRTFNYGLRKNIARNLAIYLEYTDYRHKFGDEKFEKNFGVGTGLTINF